MSSRKPHPPEVAERARELRAQGFSQSRIARTLWTELQADVGLSTVRDWVSPSGKRRVKK